MLKQVQHDGIRMLKQVQHDGIVTPGTEENIKTSASEFCSQNSQASQYKVVVTMMGNVTPGTEENSLKSYKS